MSFTISGQASYDYGLYSVTNSSAYQKNKMDPSQISEEYYGVSNLSGALSTLKNEDSISFDSVVDPETSADSLYEASGLKDYGTLRNAVDNSTESRLLSGNTDTSGLDGIGTASGTAERDDMTAALSSKTADHSALGYYRNYLNAPSAELLNELV